MNIRYPDLASLILRLGMGLLMALGHGLGKLQVLLSGEEIRFPELFGLPSTVGLSLAIFAEFFAAIMIIIGFKTRLFCIPVIITMAVAAFYIHSGDAWFMKSGGASKEPALLFLAGFIAIYLLGPGKYSLDDRISGVIS